MLCPGQGSDGSGACPKNTWCKGRIHHWQDADPPQDFIKRGELVQLTWSTCQELAIPIRIRLQYWRHHVLPCGSLVMLFVPSPRPSNRHHVFLLVPNNLHAHVFPLRIRLQVRSLCLLIVFLFSSSSSSLLCICLLFIGKLWITLLFIWMIVSAFPN